MCVLGLYAHVETSLDLGRERKVEITVQQGRMAEESTTEFTRRMIENDQRMPYYVSPLHNKSQQYNICQLLSHRIEPCMPIFTLVSVTCCLKFLMNVRSINATNVAMCHSG